jgi:uncharacterized cupin superfamily protein
MKKTVADIEPRMGSNYPPPLDAAVRGRVKYPLGNAFGLDQFGVNLTELAPGAVTALRHWHSAEDEFVYVLAGEVVLETDEGAESLGPGDFVGFKAGIANGHRLINRSSATVRLLEVGTRAIAADHVVYPDDDLAAPPAPDGKRRFTRKDGSPL